MESKGQIDVCDDPRRIRLAEVVGAMAELDECDRDHAREAAGHLVAAVDRG